MARRILTCIALVVATSCFVGVTEGRSLISPLSMVRGSTGALATPASILALRGGASSSKSKKSKKAKKKSKKTKEATDGDDEIVAATPSSSKSDISKAMKEKDAAEALGDAIRDRADILRSEDPLLQAIDWSVSSLGQALGASDNLRREGGGVEAAQSSVIAHYFLKSHGGAHLLQCVCSLLSTVAGLGALALYSKPKAVGLTYTLLQRTFLFAMLKHVSGLIAAASIAAKAIPKIGLSQSRQWMERLVTDPVSQYVFFNALMILWLPPKQRVIDGACWWWSKSLMLPLMLGPILLREVISNLWVLSDVLVLWSVGSGGSPGIESVLKISNSVLNSIMSLLVTPGVWRNAESAQKQVILSKLVSKISLVLEVGIGVLLLLDTVFGILGSAFFKWLEASTISRELDTHDLRSALCAFLVDSSLKNQTSCLSNEGWGFKAAALHFGCFIRTVQSHGD